MGILQNIFSLKNKKDNNGKIYKIITIFGIKIKILNIKRTLVEVSKETKLLRTIIEKSIDITKIPKATGNLRKVQLIKTKILQIIDVILKKHNMLYWIDFGTLIGAIRHKGFIPWDDDIDLCIMKDDYLKLPELFAKELQNKGFSYIYDVDGSELLRLNYKSFFIDFFPMEYMNKKCETEEEKNIFVKKWLKIRNEILNKHPLNDFKSGKINHINVIPLANELKKKYIDPEDLSLPAPNNPLQHLYQSGEYGEYGAVMTFPRIQDSGFAHTQIKYSSDVDYDNILHELTNIYEEIKNENNVCTANN